MILWLHISPNACGAERIQTALDAKRRLLEAEGHLFSHALGKKNHTKLFMAVTDPENVDQLRASRGYAPPESQRLLAESIRRELEAEVERTRPKSMILSCSQLAVSLRTESELKRLRGILAPLSDDIRIVMHVDEQARALARFYAEQVWSGRTAGLDQEIALAGSRDWTAAALAGWSAPDIATNGFPEVHGAPFWLDYAALVRRWETVFGPGSMRLRPYDEALFNAAQVTKELTQAFDLPSKIGKADPADSIPPPAAEWLLRARLMNQVFVRALATGRVIPRILWRRLLGELAVPGDPVAPGSLSAISRSFTAGNAQLVAANPALKPALTPDAPLPDWQATEPLHGYRATQYMAAFLPRIDSATAAAKKQAAETGPATTSLSPIADKLLPPLAKSTFQNLSGGRFAPHNRLGHVNEEELAAPYTGIAPRKLGNKNSGNVIVGCMKNEGPYIIEWVAYHRAIGVDNILIYTNDCEDGTDEILDRLQEMGVVQRRSNENWKGKSPQQAALNASLKEDMVKNAEWLIHIDVDEFMNIRTGNGTLEDLFAAVPDATNIAMTWRLFGHNGVTRLVDRPVIEQFTTCAPSYCPKPHTVWGFKTMFRNFGAYAKMSCHRPNKLDEAKRDAVKWVNGSGQPMNDSLKDKGWRSGVDSIGYDLIQLNHYALRSAESFLIKRQRGRALHVDRSIGLNYWIRMDWSDHTDVTIQRNLPRLRAEMDRLLADGKLSELHAASLDWHRKKVDGLHRMPEFKDLYEQALETRLNGMERVAYALALDMDS